MMFKSKTKIDFDATLDHFPNISSACLGKKGPKTNNNSSFEVHPNITEEPNVNFQLGLSETDWNIYSTKGICVFVIPASMIATLLFYVKVKSAILKPDKILQTMSNGRSVNKLKVATIVTLDVRGIPLVRTGCSMFVYDIQPDQGSGRPSRFSSRNRPLSSTRNPLARY